MVEVKNLTKCYGDIKAVDDISGKIHDHEHHHGLHLVNLGNRYR